jgi:ribA/ribD-fused uncharacterized protein
MKTIYFWGSTGPYGCLSNWYYSPFADDLGGIYSSVEQYMMYYKAETFEDNETAQKIMATDCPRTCKKLGRQVKNFDYAQWECVRYHIVAKGCYYKFCQWNKEIRDILLNTGESELVEASPYDRIWGIGFEEKDAEANRNKWGANLLGKALMEVRQMLRREKNDY